MTTFVAMDLLPALDAMRLAEFRRIDVARMATTEWLATTWPAVFEAVSDASLNAARDAVIILRHASLSHRHEALGRRVGFAAQFEGEAAARRLYAGVQSQFLAEVSRLFAFATAVDQTVAYLDAQVTPQLVPRLRDLWEMRENHMVAAFGSGMYSALLGIPRLCCVLCELEINLPAADGHCSPVYLKAIRTSVDQHVKELQLNVESGLEQSTNTLFNSIKTAIDRGLEAYQIPTQA